MKSVYVMGALANPEIPFIGNKIRRLGFIVYDNWWASGYDADSYLRHYTTIKKLNYKQTLQDPAAVNTYNFDKNLMDKSNIAVLIMPAGKSAHLELGYFIGTGKPGYVLFDKVPSKIDIMYQFAVDIFFEFNELAEELKKYTPKKGKKLI